jgi:hypothetical protein
LERSLIVALNSGEVDRRHEASFSLIFRWVFKPEGHS